MTFRSSRDAARLDRFHVRLELLAGAAGGLFIVRQGEKRALKSFPPHFWRDAAHVSSPAWSTIFSRFSILCAQLSSLDSSWACERSVGASETAAADVRLREGRRNRVVAPSGVGGGHIPTLLDSQRLAEVERNRAAQVSSSKRALGDAVWRAPALAARVDAYNKMVGKCLTAVSADVRLQGDEEEDY